MASQIASRRVPWLKARPASSPFALTHSSAAGAPRSAQGSRPRAGAVLRTSAPGSYTHCRRVSGKWRKLRSTSAPPSSVRSACSRRRDSHPHPPKHYRSTCTTLVDFAVAARWRIDRPLWEPRAQWVRERSAVPRSFGVTGEETPTEEANSLILLVGRLGLEPRTKALKGPCSTS